MKFEDIRSAYYDASDKASEIARQLSFAGIAVAWVLRGEAQLNRMPRELWLPLAIFCAALVVDLLQYVFKTVVWGHLTNVTPEKTTDVDAPQWYNSVTDIMWWTKVALVVLGYAVLGVRFVRQLL